MRLILILLMCALSTNARGDIFSGNKMHEACSTKSRVPIVTYVSGVVDKATNDRDYLAGSQAGLAMTEKDTTVREKTSRVLEWAVSAAKPYCIPANVTTTQMADLFCKYLAQNPATRNEGAAYLVDKALEAAWPCRVRGGAD